MTGYQQVQYVKSYRFADNYQLLYLHTFENKHILLYAKIKYGAAVHHVFLKQGADGLYWLLAPYNDAYFFTRADYPCSFDLVMHAIREHTEVHKKGC